MDATQVLFIYLAIILGLSAVLGYATKVFKLPLIVAYLIAGLILSLLRMFDGGVGEALRLFPEIGIAFVLFLVGMELDLGEIKQLGKPIVAASVVQITISTLAGYAISKLFGFGSAEALFLGIGLAFSSTIVVVKLLLDKKDLASLYGKLSLGILLIEDFVAIVVLMVLTVGDSALSIGLQEAMPFLALAGKGLLLWFASVFLSHYLLKPVFNAVSESAELLFLSALAWCFVFVAVSVSLGFSVVIGAFLAGVALANSPFHYEIQSKMKPLRDFFVALFFVYLGSQITFNDIPSVLPIIGVFTLFAIIVKPLIFMGILGMFGFKKHTIFQTSINLSQISEFSLIIMVFGLNLGLVSQTPLTIMALTGVISIVLSSIMISYSKVMYNTFGSLAHFFERFSLIRRNENRPDTKTLEKHVVIIGAHRLGGAILQFFAKRNVPVLIIDFNPRIVQYLAKERVHVLYGDVGDPEILDFLNLQEASLIISTAQDREDNMILLSEVKRKKLKVPVVTRASTIEDARLLYKAGADYVILPEIVAADFIQHILRVHWPRNDFFKNRPEIELGKLNRHIFAMRDNL